MSKIDKDELREHSFDGIQEYDNDLPRWWIYLFYITIAFALIYPFLYDFGPWQFASENIDKEVSALKAQKEKEETVASEVTEEQLLTLAKDASALAQGQTIYATRCFACHADKGAGLVGPNLTDDYWLHGGKITDIRTVITNGVLEKGMLAWKDQLKPDEINQITAYIWSLHGLSLPNAKAPQGDLVERK